MASTIPKLTADMWGTLFLSLQNTTAKELDAVNQSSHPTHPPNSPFYPLICAT